MTTRKSAHSGASGKVATGISGFDEIARGGLPRGRVTVLLGGPGCGKTIFALQSLAAGAGHRSALRAGGADGPRALRSRCGSTSRVAKSRGVTTVSTSLLANGAPLAEETPIGVSTIADTWIHVSYVSKAGERNRALTIIKSRGTGHSNQVRELVLSDAGVALADPYKSGGEVLMGTLRWERELQERRAKELAAASAELDRKQAELALAESRLRVEAARADQALHEAMLERLRVARAATEEGDRLEVEERSTRRGGDVPSSKPHARQPSGSDR